jgi:DNA-binding CsgD family transcriptional regulator
LVEAEQTCDTEEAFYSLADIAINDAIYQTLGDRLGLRPRERVVLRYSKQGEDALPRIAEALRIHETDAYILWKLVYWKTEEPTLTDLQQDVRDWLEQGKGTTEIAKMLDRDRMQISRLITTINTKLGTGYSGKGKKHNELLALAAAPEDDLRTIGLSQVHITAVRAYGNGVADHVTAPTLGIHTRAVTVKRAEALERLRHGPPTPLSSLRWKRMYWASDNGD